MSHVEHSTCAPRTLASLRPECDGGCPGQILTTTRYSRKVPPRLSATARPRPAAQAASRPRAFGGAPINHTKSNLDSHLPQPHSAHPPLSRFLDQCFAAFAGDDSGAVANYIPELSRADPKHFGIALATIDGHVYEVGDSTA